MMEKKPRSIQSVDSATMRMLPAGYPRATQARTFLARSDAARESASRKIRTGQLQVFRRQRLRDQRPDGGPHELALVVSGDDEGDGRTYGRIVQLMFWQVRTR